MTDSPKLRDDADVLSVLANRVAEVRGVDPAFLEKDFWAMEVLRIVMRPRTIGPEVDERAPQIIFKGGTSLSRIYGLVDRFSEDVDVLVAFPEAAGKASRERFLRGIVADVTDTLGLEIQNVPGSKEGVALNKRFLYPTSNTSEAITEAVLLEMGSRGGPFPMEKHKLRSILADVAVGQLGEDESTWAEWRPFDVNVLSAERTLLEKLSLLHDIASRFPASGEKLDKAGRHVYDVHCCLANSAVRARLKSLTRNGVGKLCADIESRSSSAGWTYTPRPADGFSASEFFDSNWEGIDQARAAYEIAVRDLVFSDAPSFETCLETVRVHGELI